ncbi:MAG: gliding motility-associated C-terminal domain-containing protein, partial [Bacteroidota bacterium]
QEGTLSAGRYCIVVRDGNGCLAGNACFDVLAPATLEVAVGLTNKDCAADGSISLSISGGSGNYSIDWADLAGSDNPQDRSDLTAGTYALTVTDANGCTVEASNLVIIDECIPCMEPVINNILVLESNCGGADGAITFVTRGNYTYSWTPAVSNSNAATGLIAGTYTVIIADVNNPNCFIEETVIVGNLDGPSATLDAMSNATCTSPDGSASLSPATYTYNWSDGGNGHERNDLTAGIYQITVVDPATNCIDVIQVIIDQNNDLVADAIINREPNCNAANGEVAITVTNGSGDYTYSWGADSLRTDLSSGVYTVSVQDQQTGCETTVNFILTDQAIGANIAVTNVLLDCVSDTMGTANYSLTFQNGFVEPATVLLVDEEGNEVIDGSLRPGIYCILVSDGNGCLASSACFDVRAPEAIDLVIGLTNKDCDRGGSISMEVTGGSGSYTIDWADLPGTDDPVSRTDLEPGIYAVTVTDGNGCSTFAEALFIEDECNPCIVPEISSVIVQDANCENADGTITLIPADSTRNYLYQWPGDISTNNTAMNLFAGTYTVTIVDADKTSCFTEEVIIVGNTDGPQANVVSTSPASCGQMDGRALLAPDSLAFIWSDGETGHERSDLAAGIYQVTVADPLTACINILSVEIEQENLLSAEAIINQAPTCGVNDGSVSLRVANGSGNYQYSWGPGDTQNNLSAGPYTVVIIDLISGCQTEVNFVLTDDVSSAIIAIAAEVSTSCAGSNDGAVQINSINFEPGFVQPMSLSIVDANGTVQQDSSLAPGAYCLIINDGNDCWAGESCFTVVEPTAINVDLSITNVNCTTDGAIDIQVSGGSGDYTYDWADLPGNDDPANRSGLAAGIYQLTVSDSNGCSVAVDNLIVGDDCNSCDDPVIENITVTHTNCGNADGQIDIDMVGGDQNFLFLWNPSVSNTDTAGTLAAGSYEVTIVDAANPACQIVNTIIVNNEDGPVASIASSTPADCGETNGSVELSPADLNYLWNSGSTANFRNDLAPGNYQVTVTNGNGCSNILEIQIGEDCSSDCPDLITQDTLMYRLNNCADTAALCIDIPLEDFRSYQVFDNGIPYTSLVLGCSIDSTRAYPIGGIPGYGFRGPYTLDSWTVEGQTYSTDFDDLSELLDSMNVWDPIGNWTYNDEERCIKSTNLDGNYGRIVVTYQMTGAVIRIDPLLNQFSNGSILSLTRGWHEMIFNHSLTGCADTVDIYVSCIRPETIIDTIWVNQNDTLCLDTDELEGEIVSIENVCEESSGEYVIFDIIDGEVCVTCYGAEVGLDSACMVVCDEFGLCDTTYLFISVIERTVETGPIANPDIDTTYLGKGLEVVILENDSINGILDTVYILSPPKNGTATIDPQGVITYIPNEDYCDSDDPDQFVYILCNESACDTALVSIYVLCDEIIVFTGVSPNGDGINDELFIQGIEGFPNNELTIFNRWGNQVYSQKGYLNDWGGTYKGKLLPDGTYYYILDDGEGRSYSGYIQIHR